jgi:hypothetical protein
VFNNTLDPKGPIYVTIGDGGNRKGLYSNWHPAKPWSSAHAATYGHGELEVLNATHAHWSWHTNPDLETKTEDEVWLVKGQAAH